MKVWLIDYTGKGSSDPLYAAKLLCYTKDTRLEQGMESFQKIMDLPYADVLEKLDYISKTIRSSWEMVDFIFGIEGVTRAFTHQFVRTRTGSYAQQSQRSVDMSGFTAEEPASIKHNTKTHHIWDIVIGVIDGAYKRFVEEGIPPQDARGLLPTNVHTNIIAKFNLRTLADLAGKRDNPRAQGEYNQVYKLMAAEVMHVMPWTKQFLYPERTATPALDSLLKEALGSASPVMRPKINDALKELDMLKSVWG